MNDLIVQPSISLATPGEETGVSSLTRAQKAAIILSVIDPSDAAEILQNFREPTLMHFAKAVSDLKPISSDEVTEVVLEFLTELGDGNDVRGGIEQVRKYLGEFLPEDNVNRIIEDIAGQTDRPVWERLGEAQTTTAATYLGNEHPQTIAFILSKLKPDRAAAVLELLDREVGQSAVLRMARIASLDPQTTALIESTIDEKFLSAVNRQSATAKPAEVIGNLMNNIAGEARDQFLEYLENTDSKLAADITKVMFTFADIATRVPTNGVPVFIKDVEDDVLMAALRYARDKENPSYEFIMSNMSKRMAERYNEEVEAMDAVKPKDGEVAQMEIVKVIQMKAKAGDILLHEPENE